MKKSTLELTLFLLIIAILTIACGSDSNSKSSNSFKFENKNNTKNNNDNSSYSPLTKEEYDSAVKKVYEKSKEECAPIEDFFNDSSWPAMYYEDDDDTPTDKLQEKVKNLRKISVDASEKFPTPAEYSTYDIESSTQLEKLHLATSEFVKNVNTSGFGPCKI